MPLIALIGVHASTDAPMHDAFFAFLHKRGLLDRYDFALDPMTDVRYCLKLKSLYPQLHLTEDVDPVRRPMRWMRDHIGRGYGPLSRLGRRYDAVCHGPGGAFNGSYMKGNIFRHWRKARRYAILFQSIEASALRYPLVSHAVRSADIVITRTSASAERARAVGARRVVSAGDAVFLTEPRKYESRPGLAVALRIPQDTPTQEHIERVRSAIDMLEQLGPPVDFVRVEEPLGEEMAARGYGHGRLSHVGMYWRDTMYDCFRYRRDAIISARLHTTLVSLLSGNTKIIQFVVEDGTTKNREMLGDIGLERIPVYDRHDLTADRIRAFLEGGPMMSPQEVCAGVAEGRRRAMVGWEAFEEWLETL